MKKTFVVLKDKFSVHHAAEVTLAGSPDEENAAIKKAAVELAERLGLDDTTIAVGTVTAPDAGAARLLFFDVEWWFVLDATSGEFVDINL